METCKFTKFTFVNISYILSSRDVIFFYSCLLEKSDCQNTKEFSQKVLNSWFRWATSAKLVKMRVLQLWERQLNPDVIWTKEEIKSKTLKQISIYSTTMDWLHSNEASKDKKSKQNDVLHHFIFLNYVSGITLV